MRALLDTDIKYLPGMGEHRAKVFAKEIGVRTYRDLLYYFPYKHIDRTRIYKTVEVNEQLPYIQLKGVITSKSIEGEGNRKRLKAIFQDPYGEIELVWFNSIPYFRDHLKLNTPYLIFGKPTRFGNTYSIAHPEVDDLKNPKQASAGKLYPMYSTTERMKKLSLNSKFISELVYKLLDLIKDKIPETLPSYIIEHYNMLSLQDSLRQIHAPEDEDMLRRASARLKMEEIFYVRLRMQYLKEKRRHETEGILLPKVGEEFKRLYSEVLPFDLTEAQKRVVREIHTDLQTGKQMNRLVQGDVGSGKTVVALLTMLLAVDNGYQACMMAPTEILARQHYESLSQLLAPLSTSIRLLTGSTKAKEKREITAGIADGSINILVGTHALIEDYVQFRRLAVAVIDEQHRFGVNQRSIMWEKNHHVHPHILIMSATPIPRTLAMTLYGDLDVSVIDELPPGRTPIRTAHYYESNRPELNFFIRDQIEEGRQVYVVHPLIEESEKMDYKSLEEGFEMLKEAFPTRNIGIVHGKLKPAEKEEAMSLFVSGKTDILVATTVIEVGVNVPNATVMVIESAERFGLSQLHQLRGRVGRGSKQSYCVLMTGNNLGEDSRKRIGIMVETTNGFRIAEEDLKLRGHGDMEGVRQSGIGLDFKIANLAKDGRIVQFCVNLVEQILHDDPLLESPLNLILRQQITDILKHEKDWGLIS
ncbi:ATP-dependent DNA helicase RecG [Porphyromonas sp.]|uniref:ATP-dependent DNA helicase RecG n=1 Tax=Porphyromonas sp. TaxID=1924944 RepID=UPI0026DCCDEA|nr:ATP-dependent DNA helicase RecG [Porphyromonas sp.]MDO4770863.1 ATP-dependent DNA helicase RecG [Porphyromonas sp.]